MKESDKKSLLIAGGGYADVPLIRAGQALGYRVITSGNRTSDLGHRVSDAYRAGDFSDPEAMLEIAESEGVDAVCPNCNDFSALSCAYVAEQLGLPGHDTPATARLIHHKDRFRDYAQSKGLPCPEARNFTDREKARRFVQKLSRPVIVKPVDLTGGKGIQRADDTPSAERAIDEAFDSTRAGRIVVEEFVEGTNHGFTCLLRDRKVVFHFFDNEQYFLNPYLVSGASAPGDVPAHAVRELIQVAENMAEDLKLVDGIFHVQFILRQDGPVLIEICRRPPGDLYLDLVRHATGVDYALWVVRAAAGLGLEHLEHAPTTGFYGRHCIMADRNGTVSDLDIDPSVQGKIVESVTWWKPGDLIADFRVNKLGIVFLRFDDAEDMRRSMDDMPQLIKPRVIS